MRSHHIDLRARDLTGPQRYGTVGDGVDFEIDHRTRAARLENELL